MGYIKARFHVHNNLRYWSWFSQLLVFAITADLQASVMMLYVLQQGAVPQNPWPMSSAVGRTNSCWRTPKLTVAIGIWSCGTIQFI